MIEYLIFALLVFAGATSNRVVGIGKVGYVWDEDAIAYRLRLLVDKIPGDGLILLALSVFAAATFVGVSWQLALAGGLLSALWRSAPSKGELANLRGYPEDSKQPFKAILDFFGVPKEDVMEYKLLGQFLRASLYSVPMFVAIGWGSPVAILGAFIFGCLVPIGSFFSFAVSDDDGRAWGLSEQTSGAAMIIATLIAGSVVA